MLNKDSMLGFFGATNDANPSTLVSTKRGTQWLKESKDRSKNQTARRVRIYQESITTRFSMWTLLSPTPWRLSLLINEVGG